MTDRNAYEGAADQERRAEQNVNGAGAEEQRVPQYPPPQYPPYAQQGPGLYGPYAPRQEARGQYGPTPYGGQQYAPVPEVRSQYGPDQYGGPQYPPDQYGRQPYGPPQPYPEARGQSGIPPQGKPNPYWGLTIPATILSLVVGGVGLYFSFQVGTRWDRGDAAGSEKASQMAKLWGGIGLVLGILVLLYNFTAY